MNLVTEEIEKAIISFSSTEKEFRKLPDSEASEGGIFQVVGGFAESGDHRFGGNRPTMDSKSIAFENTM